MGLRVGGGACISKSQGVGEFMALKVRVRSWGGSRARVGGIGPESGGVWFMMGQEHVR